MMSRFKLSNEIFKLGLDCQEMSVYAYLCSLPTNQYTVTGESTVRVKQSTIAQKCGLKAVQTVSKIISRLAAKGLAEPIERSVKANRYKGTYRYSVKQLTSDNGYFYVDRFIFGKLVPRQMMIYLFICKSFSIKLRDSWNSYNDISQQTGMKRETVIQTINELTALKLIVKSRRKSRDNKRVFVDNHYQVIFYVRGTFKGKKIVRLHSQYSRTNGQSHNVPFNLYYYSTLTDECQGNLRFFSSVRGSPYN